MSQTHLTTTSYSLTGIRGVFGAGGYKTCLNSWCCLWDLKLLWFNNISVPLWTSHDLLPNDPHSRSHTNWPKRHTCQSRGVSDKAHSRSRGASIRASSRGRRAQEHWGGEAYSETDSGLPYKFCLQPPNSLTGRWRLGMSGTWNRKRPTLNWYPWISRIWRGGWEWGQDE